MSDIKRLKGFSLFVEGRGYAGKVSELVLPKLTRKVEEWRAGGMNCSIDIDVGMEKLESDFTLGEYDKDVLLLFGVTHLSKVGVRIKGSMESESDGSVTPVDVVLRGKWKELDSGTWKAGDSATLKVSMSVDYYKYTSGGVTLIEIDIPNGVEKIGGVDRLAARRAALGIG